MSSLDVPVRSLVVEWRYDPNLAIYSVMDRVGIEFKESYPDWQRTPLTLELKSKKHRRRLLMAFNRSFFHAADIARSDATIEVDKACEVFERAAEWAEIKSLARIGLRQWAAFPQSEPFKELISRFAKKFHPSSEKLLTILNGSIDDLSYVVDVNHTDGWKYSLRIGPMLKPQWFEVVSHDESAFESAESFNEYKEAFPGSFLYVDIDANKGDVPYSDSKTLLRSMREGSHAILKEIHDYLREM